MLLVKLFEHGFFSSELRLWLLDPGVLQALKSCDPVLWFYNDHFSYQVLGTFRDQIWVALELSCSNFLKNILHLFAVEWEVPGKKLVKADSQGPNITLFAIDSWKHVGCDVIRCSGNLMLSSSIVCLDAKSEINQFGHVSVWKHDVLRLYIPMNNILRVAMLQSLQQISKPARGLFLTYPAAFLHDSIQ